MLLNTLTRWGVVLVCVAGLCGCAKKSTPQEPPAKTAAEYKAEADKQIDEKNADAELQKLEQSINQDAAAQ
jgi:predicted small lipoprotein YifL